MAQKKSVLMIGLRPEIIDFSLPDYAAFPGMTAEKVSAGLNADQSQLQSLGYDCDLCLTDFGETAEAVATAALKAKPYDCVMIGAGVRTIKGQFLLFEKLINVVHRNAPQAAICFNSRPDDSAAAVQRWV